MNCKSNRTKAFSRSAFTLIELLVVIAIIGIIAALVAGLAGPAATKRKVARVRAELAGLETAIESYQLKRGSFPPDNGNLVNEGASRPSSATNQLFYELLGAEFNPANNTFNASGNIISKANVRTYFDRGGIANSIETKKFLNIKDGQHKSIVDGGDIQVLVVPVALEDGNINPWHYDSSSTNRHNLETYDLWAEISLGKKTMIIGNWKE